MIKRISLKNIEIPNHFPRDVENNLPGCWKHQLTEWRNLPESVELIRDELCNYGCVLIKDFDIFGLNMSLKRNIFLGLCSCIGIPVEHNLGETDYIWDIRPRENIASFPTFSEHNLEAPPHTDSQYRIDPETYISLFVLERARCGGGKTTVLRFADIINTLQETIEGRKCLRILEHELFPFAVPSIFSKDRDNVHLIFAPIITEGNNIRYRFDTIQQGLRHGKSLERDNTMKIWALNFFRDHIENHSSTMSLSLANGTILFLNNQRVLHGRTSFTDPNRHILRIRMNNP